MITVEERLNRLENLVSRIIEDTKSDIRVSLPAKITSFDSVKQTVSCIPTIRELVNINGEVKYTTLPTLQDVPIIIPRAGNWALTLPIKAGDECIVIFQDLCIDGWWSRGDIQNWNDLRRHDLSDAIAIFSPWSQPNTIPSYSSSNAELRSLDGSIKISMTTNGIIVDAPQGVVINGNTTINGDTTCTGTVTGQTDVIAGTISGKTHKHGDVQTGSAKTGFPE